MNLRLPNFGRSLLGPALVLAVTGFGCSPAEEDAVEPPPPVILFEGTVDSKYVGKWVTENKNSTMILEESGKASMINVAPGRGTSESSGEWKLSGSDLLIKLDGSTGKVSKYASELKGDLLRLKQASTRLNIEYKRAP